MATELKPNQVVTGRQSRMAFPNLFSPRPDDAEIDAGKYTVMVLVPKTDTETVDAMKAAVKASLNGKSASGMRLPVKDGDSYFAEKIGQAGDKDKAKLEKSLAYYKGHYYINVKSNTQPKVVDPMKNVIEDGTKVNSGDYGRVLISFAAYDKAGNKGVGAYMDAVQWLRQGEVIGSTAANRVDAFDVESEELDEVF